MTIEHVPGQSLNAIIITIIMNCINKFPQPMTVKHVPGQGDPAENALDGSVTAHTLVFGQQASLRRRTMVRVILGTVVTMMTTKTMVSTLSMNTMMTTRTMVEVQKGSECGDAL